MTPIVYLSIASLLLTVFLHRCGVQAQATTTLTETRFVTQTSMMSTDVTCAKVVNVTGICRRRRGFKLDTPVVLIFDETMDIDLEQPLSPTQTLSVEPTAVAKLPSGEIVMAGIASDVIESSKRTRRSADTVFSSSNSNDSAADDRSETLLDLDDKQNRPPRFPFLNAIFSGIVSNIVNNRPNGLLANLFGLNSLRSTVSITQTQVISTTVTYTTGNLNSFFIMGCTPSPFPHLICTSASAFIRKQRPPPTS